MNMNRRNLFLVVGAESTGTRYLTDLLTQHPDVYGPENAKYHNDILDEVWNSSDAKLPEELMQYNNIITRRSMPHSRKPKQSARYLDFPDLYKVILMAGSQYRHLTLLVTVRSPTANLTSWTLERASASRKYTYAYIQYQLAYRNIFEFISKHSVNYYICPYEAILLDGASYMNSLYLELGLSSFSPEIKANKTTNINRYEQYILEKFNEQ